MTNQVDQECIRLLIVDDDESIGRMLSRVLTREGYSCTAVRSGQDAIRELERDHRDLLIADINMPEINGVDLLKWTMKQDSIIAVIMLTGVQDLHTAVGCLKLGAYDYLTKPVNLMELSVSVSRALERRTFLIREKQYTETLEKEVRKKTAALEHTQKEIIYRLALAAEYRDENTWEHLVRISDSSYILADKMGIPKKSCEIIRTVSPLHDIGKIGIPDSILLKPGPLTTEEYELMKNHTVIGRKILSNSESDLIRVACDIAIAHHERYNGDGYPHRKKREEIPTAARIVAVVDVFDALTSKRPYKEPWSVDRAVDTIVKERGTHFDPDAVDAFTATVDEIVELRHRPQNSPYEKPLFIEPSH